MIVQCATGWESLYGPIIEQARAEGVKVWQVKDKVGELRIQVGFGGLCPK